MRSSPTRPTEPQMDAAQIRLRRLRSHLLVEPAATVPDVARRLFAVQAQDFAAGRWALGIRTSGGPAVGDVDRAFDAGLLVRAWTQRGTLHIVEPGSVGAILDVTGERQTRAYGIDPGVLDRGERVFRSALAAEAPLTRAAFVDALQRDGVAGSVAAGTRILTALSIRGVLALGPVVPRDEGVAREQYLVALPPRGPAGDDPAVDLLVAYLRGHGPATGADFAWWAGLPAGQARGAAGRAGDRVVALGGELLDVPDEPTTAVPDPALPGTIALPAFDEYVLSYADRSIGMGAGDRMNVGPTANGMVRPVILRGGVAVGTWSLSLAVGSSGIPAATLFDGQSDAGVGDALARVGGFFGRQ